MAAGLSAVLAPERAETEATGTRAALRVLGGLALLLGAVYSAVLVLPYAELDDYSMLANNLLGRRNWVLPTRGGRPLYGGLISLFAGDLTSVTDLWRLRLI